MQIGWSVCVSRIHTSVNPRIPCQHVSYFTLHCCGTTCLYLYHCLAPTHGCALNSEVAVIWATSAEGGVASRWTAIDQLCSPILLLNVG